MIPVDYCSLDVTPRSDVLAGYLRERCTATAAALVTLSSRAAAVLGAEEIGAPVEARGEQGVHDAILWRST